MNGSSAELAVIATALLPHGLHLRGTVDLSEGEGPVLADGATASAVVLIGNIGGSIWESFSAWRRTYRGAHPLDAWSKAIIQPIAEEVGAESFFPSDPPWQPFQQWAMKAEGLKSSPLGILVHPNYGLWHGYRGALAFKHRLGHSRALSDHPCEACTSKPCMSTCPVEAVHKGGFDVPRCRSYLASVSGSSSCVTSGCIARSSCPVGAAHSYPVEQLRFHMDAIIS